MSIKQYEYFKTDLGTLYCGDCLEIMQLFPDNHFDLCLTDPPYGIRADENPIKGKFIYEKTSWDRERPDKDIFDLLILKSKNQIIWGGNYFTDYLYPSMGWICWYKRENFSLADAELAWTSFYQAMRVYKYHAAKAMQDGAYHPTQKAVDLMYFCMDFAKTQDTDIILDCFSGSGTTALACERRGKKWVSIEVNEKYCEIAARRIEDEARQGKFDL